MWWLFLACATTDGIYTLDVQGPQDTHYLFEAEMQKPTILGFDGDGLAARYDPADLPTFRLPLSPYAGGWTVHGKAGLAGGATALYVDHTVAAQGRAYPNAAAQLTASKPLDLPYDVTHAPAGTIYSISRFQMGYSRAAAGDSVEFRIYRAPKAMDAQPTAIYTRDSATHFTTATGAHTIYTDAAVGLALDTSLYEYWCEVRFISAVLASDAQISGLYLDLIKGAVE